MNNWPHWLPVTVREVSVLLLLSSSPLQNLLTCPMMSSLHSTKSLLTYPAQEMVLPSQADVPTSQTLLLLSSACSPCSDLCHFFISLGYHCCLLTGILALTGGRNEEPVKVLLFITPSSLMWPPSRIWPAGWKKNPLTNTTSKVSFSLSLKWKQMPKLFEMISGKTLEEWTPLKLCVLFNWQWNAELTHLTLGQQYQFLQNQNIRIFYRRFHRLSAV